MTHPDLAYKLNDFLRRNKALIIYSFIIAIICYGYELFNFSLSIDEELQSFSSAVNLKKLIQDGRWGSYFINILLSPHSLMPYLPTLILILCLALTSILFIANEKGDLQSQIIFSTIFISYPLHSYYMEFNILGAPVGIGMILSTISYLIIKESLEIHKRKFLLSSVAILMLTFSFSMYQALVPFLISLVLIHYGSQLLNNECITIRLFVKQIFYFFIIYLLAFLLYLIIDRFFKILFIPEFQNLSSYTDHYLGWGKSTAKKVFFILLGTTKDYLSGKKFYGSYSIKSIFVLIPFLLYIILSKVKVTSHKVLVVTILFISLFIPFIVMYYTGSKLPPRSLVALPLMLAGFWWLTSLYSKQWMKTVLIIIAFLFFLSNTYHTTRLFYTSYVSWQADRDMANRIIERIYSLDLPEKDPIKIVFIGKYKHPENELFLKTNDAFGSSFFYWGRGEFPRINAVFKTKGITNLKLATSVEQEKIVDSIDSLPSWPKKGSVTIKDGIVVVKLSDQNRIKK
jgi:hypothetical protein